MAEVRRIRLRPLASWRCIEELLWPRARPLELELEPTFPLFPDHLEKILDSLVLLP